LRGRHTVHVRIACAAGELDAAAVQAGRVHAGRQRYTRRRRGDRAAQQRPKTAVYGIHVATAAVMLAIGVLLLIA
jgi:hypothetical protein